MTKLARVTKELRINNAGSKKVPILMIGTSRTRSGKKFRHRVAAPEPQGVPEVEIFHDIPEEEIGEYLDAAYAVQAASYSAVNAAIAANGQSVMEEEHVYNPEDAVEIYDKDGNLLSPADAAQAAINRYKAWYAKTYGSMFALSEM